MLPSRILYFAGDVMSKPGGLELLLAKSIAYIIGIVFFFFVVGLAMGYFLAGLG
tara:strand:- start:150 stop:311 length:162 start_codon:yes stop_codon:yes gene_type:complete